MDNSRMKGFMVLALVVATMMFAGDEALAQINVQEGSGWVETTVDVNVHLDPKAGAMVATGDATLRLANAVSSTAALWVNFGRYSKKPVMTFTSVTGPPGSAVDLNVTNDRYPGTFFSVVHLGHPAHRGDSIRVSFEVKSLRGNAFTLTLADPVSVVGEENGWYPQTLYDDGKLDADREKTVGATTFAIPPAIVRFPMVGTLVVRNRAASA